MKILIVTSKTAYNTVKEEAEKLASKKGWHVQVHRLEASVALLHTMESLSDALSNRTDLQEYDLIVIPGGIEGDARTIEERVGVKTVKGPRHASDIYYTLSNLEPEELSPIEPADEILARLERERFRDLLKLMQEDVARRSHIRVGELNVPLRPPPIIVIGEIVNAYKLGESEAIKRAEYAARMGAGIVGLGFGSPTPNPDLVYKLIRAVKRELDLPVAVDSMNPAEINSAVKAGVDLILSIDPTIADKVCEEAKPIPAVVLPTRVKEGYVPRDASEKVKALKENLQILTSRGYEALILDPILEPPISPGTLESLMAYREVSRTIPDFPIMMGIGNVVELIDSDSTGVTGLIVSLAGEAGASLVLAVEHSHKARGAIGEAYLACLQVSAALYLKRPPKDLPVNTLFLKEKRLKHIRQKPEGITVVEAEDLSKSFNPDPLGNFRIWVDHDAGKICALYEGVKGKMLIQGESAENVGKKIIGLKLVSELTHALYLGRELQKAEIALRMGRSYEQDQQLFVPIKDNVRRWMSWMKGSRRKGSW